MTDAGIFCIIVSKFSYKNGSGPIILFVIDKSSKIGLYCIVLPFCLAISLRVEPGEELLLDLKEVI